MERQKPPNSIAGLNLDVASINLGWEGHLRLHISNNTAAPVRRLYAFQGIVYLEFHEIDGEVERHYGKLSYPRFQDSAT